MRLWRKSPELGRKQANDETIKTLIQWQNEQIKHKLDEVEQIIKQTEIEAAAIALHIKRGA